jgi:hypothetical protein
MLSAPFISDAIIAAKSRVVTYPIVQISGATSDDALKIAEQTVVYSGKTG